MADAPRVSIFDIGADGELGLLGRPPLAPAAVQLLPELHDRPRSSEAIPGPSPDNSEAGTVPEVPTPEVPVTVPPAAATAWRCAHSDDTAPPTSGSRLAVGRCPCRAGSSAKETLEVRQHPR